MRWLGIVIGWMLITAPAWAWNEEGHRAVGLIAERRLSPAAKAWIARTLSYHPYASARSFSEAPCWPDQIRSDPRYRHGPWHYTNLPYFLDIPERPLEITGDALGALNRCTRVLKDAHADPQSKAVALCWVAHLVGDIHQPLHAVNTYSAAFPEGDRGGQDYRVTLGSQTTNLHTFWDSAGGLFWKGANRYRLPSVVDDLTASAPSAVEVADHDPAHWLEESHRLAAEVVYAGAAVDLPLSPEYVARARDVAGQRIALGGFRLGDYLERLYQAQAVAGD